MINRMLIKRTLPPAAAPIPIHAVFRGFKGVMRGQAEIDDFMLSLKDHFKVKHCFLLSSGKAALTIILRALKQNFPDRNEVLIPAFTCYSVPSAIIRAGLKVRLCDVNPATLNYDDEKLKATLKHTDRLLAIVGNHLFGIPSDINRIRTLLIDPEVFIIEDAAQAMGNVFNKKLLGTLGDIGFFSLGRGKAFSTVDGGIVLTNSDGMAERIESVIPNFAVQSSAHRLNHLAYAIALSAFMHPSFFWIPKSMPMLKLGETIFDPEFPIKQFSAFQAGLARNWKMAIAAFQQVRAGHAAFWAHALGHFDWIESIPKTNGRVPAYPLLRFPVLVQNAALRENLLEMSDQQGLGLMPSYPDSIDAIGELKYESCATDFPGAKACAERLLTLPVHGFLSSKDRQRIIGIFEKVHANASSLFELSTLISGSSRTHHIMHFRLMGVQMPGSFRTHKLLSVKGLTLFAMWMVVFYPLFPQLIKAWTDDPNNSHGLLVPLIAAFYIWKKRPELKGCPIQVDLRGVFLLFGSLSIYVLSLAGGISVSARCMMVFSLMGLVLYNYGAIVFKKLSFPLFFLLFMIPVPVSILTLISLPLQHLATDISAALIQFVSIPVYQEGNILYFARTQLEVAQACSGIQSMMAMLMLGILFVYHNRMAAPGAALLIALTVPIAIFANIIRVTGTGILAHFYGARVAQGFLHEFSGMAVFVFGLVILMGTYQMLQHAYGSKLKKKYTQCGA